MSPNQGETAVCGSSIFVGWLGGGDHWLPLNRASCPPTNWDTNTGVVGRFGVKSSDSSSNCYTSCYRRIYLAIFREHSTAKVRHTQTIISTYNHHQCCTGGPFQQHDRTIHKYRLHPGHDWNIALGKSEVQCTGHVLGPSVSQTQICKRESKPNVMSWRSPCTSEKRVSDGNSSHKN